MAVKALHIKQEYAVHYLKDDVTEEVLYGGAAGGGKSALGCLWLIEMCQRYPGTRWLMGRSKLKALKETTLNTFFELTNVDNLNIKSQFEYKEMQGVIKWRNGSEILLKDLFLYPSDPEFDSLGSLEITGAFIDECNQVAYKAWMVVKSRIRYKLTEYGLSPKMLGTCNPAKNWVYQQFYNPYRMKKLEPHRQFIQSLPGDNPGLPASYIQNLMRMDKNSRERLLFGNWEYDDDPATLIATDAIYDYFNAYDPIEKTGHVKPEGRKYLTIDVARKGRDKTIFRVWHGWLCIHRVVILKSPLTEVVSQARFLRTKHNIALSDIVADEDGVGGGVVDFLGCRGFINNSSPLEVYENETRIKPNFDNLKSQCSVKMAEKITKRLAGEICTDDVAVQYITAEMEQVKLKDVDKDGKVRIVPKEKVKELLNRSPDEWDSIMMRYYLEICRPMEAVEVIYSR